MFLVYRIIFNEPDKIFKLFLIKSKKSSLLEMFLACRDLFILLNNLQNIKCYFDFKINEEIFKNSIMVRKNSI